MKRKQFSVEQIVAVLKQAELGMSVTDIIWQVGITEHTFYLWKNSMVGYSRIRCANSSTAR